MAISVVAPASSANLGPGFDALGLALELYNRVSASLAERTVVIVRGEGEGQLSAGEDNLTYRAVARAFASRGQGPPPLRLECENRIPLARGLGSSAAATVAGLLIGNALLGGGREAEGSRRKAEGGRQEAAEGERQRIGPTTDDRPPTTEGWGPLSPEELLALATEMEGHPDNVAACLFGGLQACVTLQSGQVARCSAPVPPELSAVVLVPSFAMDTHAARQLLPETVPLRSAVHNIGRTALLVAAMAAGELDLLRVATEDAIHQPPRQALFPALPKLLATALEAGAHGAFLSGAGSSVLALVSGRSDQVAEALAATARQCGVESSVMAVALSGKGARIE